MAMFRITALTLTVFLAGCASKPSDRLEQQLTQQILAAGFAPEQVALVVRPVTAAALTPPASAAITHNADLLMQPASTLKLLTSAVALDQLGPLWRGSTELLADGADLAQARHSGVLHQPLFVRGKGNPDLNHAAVMALLAELYNEGVRELRGGIVLDRSWFQPQLPDPTLPPFDGSPRARYNHIPDALALDQQMLLMKFKSNATELKLTTLPLLHDLQLRSELRLSDTPCDQFNPDLVALSEHPRPDGTVQLVLRGEFPRHCEFAEEAAWLSPDLLWQLSVTQSWRQLGGRLNSPLRIVAGSTPADAVVVANHQSRPLPQLVQQVNKSSDNGLTRILALQLGRLASADVMKAGSDTSQAAEQVVMQWLAQQQIPTAGLVLDNGSGLSRKARISANQLAALLQLAWQQPWGPDLTSSLPRAGMDGTLQNRLKNTAAFDQARLKTGTLRNATGLAGYVYDRQGRPWIFVGLVNAEQGVSKGRSLLDLWVQQVSQF